MNPVRPLVRLATESDDARIGELLVDSFVRGYALKMPHVVVTDTRKADLRDVASKRARAAVLVAETPGNQDLLGTATLFRPADPTSRAWTPDTAEIRYLAIDLARRGQGISGALLDACVAQARAWGARAICLHVRRGALGVAQVYVRYGFERAPEGDADLLPEIYLEAYLLRL